MDNIVRDCTCSICLELFGDGPKVPLVLPCGHTFCFSCLLTQQKNAPDPRLTCPNCNRKFNLVEVGKCPVNFLVRSIAESVREMRRASGVVEEEPAEEANNLTPEVAVLQGADIPRDDPTPVPHVPNAPEGTYTRFCPAQKLHPFVVLEKGCSMIVCGFCYERLGEEGENQLCIECAACRTKNCIYPKRGLEVKFCDACCILMYRRSGAPKRCPFCLVAETEKPSASGS